MGTNVQSLKTKGQVKPRPKRTASMNMLLIKSLFAIVTGVVLGAVPITGMIGFMIFVPFQYLICQFYCTLMEVPDYLFDKIDIFTEHTLPSFGLFLVC